MKSLAQRPEGTARQPPFRGRQPPFPAAGRQQPIDFPLQPSVFLLSRATKRADDILGSPVADRVRGEYGGLTAEGDDLAPNPLEVLTTLRRIRQDVHGIPGRHGADLLEATPRLDPRVRGTSRKLVPEEQPAGIGHVTNVTRSRNAR